MTIRRMPSNLTVGAAIKSITLSDLGPLVPSERDNFIHTVEDETKALGEVRRYDMDGLLQNIDKTGFAGRAMQSGKDQSGTSVDFANSQVDPDFSTNEIRAVEVGFTTGYNRLTLLGNLERSGLSQTLTSLTGKQAANDIEELAFYGDTTILYSTDKLLSATDGWIKLAKHKPIVSAYKPENVVELFSEALKVLPKKYLTNRANYRFYVPYEVEDAYRDYLATRGTALGDSATTEAEGLTYKGIKIVHVPALDSMQPGVTKQYILLTNIENTVYGVSEDIVIAPEDKPSKREVLITTTAYVGFGYENEDAAVAVEYVDAPALP